MSLQSSWLQFAAMFVLVRDLVIKAYNILQANVFPCSQQFNQHSQWTKYSVRRAWRRTLTVAKLRKNGFIGNERSITFCLYVVNADLSPIAQRRFPLSTPLSHSRGSTSTSKAALRRITETSTSLWLLMSTPGSHLFSHVLMCLRTQSLSALHRCSHLLECQHMSIQTTELHL